MVGAAGFEPTTFCAQGRRATRLRYAPPQTLDDAGSTSAGGASKAQIPGCHSRVLQWVMFDQTPEEGRPGRAPSINVLGGPLQPCSAEPLTGFYRDACCNTGREDMGLHTVCTVMTAEFLAFSKARGNDLSTPMPQYGFAGLKPGDRWCLCAARWKEALDAGSAPQVVLEATHAVTLQIVSLDDQKKYAVRLQ